MELLNNKFNQAYLMGYMEKEAGTKGKGLALSKPKLATKIFHPEAIDKPAVIWDPESFHTFYKPYSKKIVVGAGHPKPAKGEILSDPWNYAQREARSHELTHWLRRRNKPIITKLMRDHIPLGDYIEEFPAMLRATKIDPVSGKTQALIPRLKETWGRWRKSLPFYLNKYNKIYIDPNEKGSLSSFMKARTNMFDLNADLAKEGFTDNMRSVQKFMAGHGKIIDDADPRLLRRAYQMLNPADKRTLNIDTAFRNAGYKPPRGLSGIIKTKVPVLGEIGGAASSSLGPLAWTQEFASNAIDPTDARQRDALSRQAAKDENYFEALAQPLGLGEQDRAEWGDAFSKSFDNWKTPGGIAKGLIPGVGPLINNWRIPVQALNQAGKTLSGLSGTQIGSIFSNENVKETHEGIRDFGTDKKTKAREWLKMQRLAPHGKPYSPPPEYVRDYIKDVNFYNENAPHGAPRKEL